MKEIAAIHSVGWHDSVKIIYFKKDNSSFLFCFVFGIDPDCLFFLPQPSIVVYRLCGVSATCIF